MPRGIRASVGAHSRNNYDDVELVQRLLNSRGANPRLVIDGIYGPRTAGAIARFQQAIFGRSDGIITPRGLTLAFLLGRRRMEQVNNRVDNIDANGHAQTGSFGRNRKPGSSNGIHSICNLPLEGPQCFAPARPGSVAVNSCLLEKNKEVARKLTDAADRYRAAKDLRWFFTRAHAEISHAINDNIYYFGRPNALIRLNMHFAIEYLRAVDGLPHEQWQRAFRDCQRIDRIGVLPAEAMACGAVMARTHINIDLSAALNEVGCIPPEDFGNILDFVNDGADVAIQEAYGEFPETVVVQLALRFREWTQLEKKWRNAAYQQACGMTPPNPTPNFAKPTQ